MDPESYERNLVAYVNRSVDEEEEFHFLRFEFLQRLNITQLEVKLARLKSQVHAHGQINSQEQEILQRTLRDYATAIRDYRFIQGHKSLKETEARDRKLLLKRFFQSVKDVNDPFSSHYAFFQDAETKIDPMRDALMRHLPSRLTFSKEERRQRSKEYHDGKLPKEVSQLVDRSVRFAVAVTGGLFLVIPMIIMTLRPSDVKSLITVSAFVLLFALCLSFVVKVSNIETLVSTATYAAVLVVFVGTSTGSSG
ncbi:Hypothetical protein NCS54_00738000 [Fusarium falciforme]|uniref:Hypothetical protein n=1 Tax=Fusarium falciforme TaxID=195108 RepID=UPI00230094FF|nr:Hypothetical protein NCS54_00738000 [Fusarium falciforme]WAO89976.1 Hypothetical protein NCS54_00738000 [Fusarium falciforme]